VPSAKPKRLALFTDIDDTLIARDGSAELLQAAQKVGQFLAEHDILFVLVTGTEYGAVKKRIAAGEIPMPNGIIGAVGTDIWLRSGGSWQRDEAYQDWLKDTGYNKSKVTLRAGEFIQQAPASYQLSFEQLPPSSKFKVTMNFMASPADAAMLTQQVRETFADFKVIVCQEIHFNATLPADATVFKYCLDIVPATKADALSYLVHQLGITGGWKAGDSGNDVDMLLNPDPLVPILVGGYKPEALAEVEPLLKLSSLDGPIRELQDGRPFYLEDSTKRAAQSILRAIELLRLVHSDVAGKNVE
jgi:hydroxymethylpyrimidine pyrophosphatase-like HAD family hydrolase